MAMPKLLEVFKRVISEAKCPYCGTDGAYVGLHDVECKNQNCQHYAPQKKGDGAADSNLYFINCEKGTKQKPSGWQEAFGGVGGDSQVMYDPKHWSASPSTGAIPPPDTIATGYIGDTLLKAKSPQAKKIAKIVHDAVKGSDDPTEYSPEVATVEKALENAGFEFP